MTRAMKTTQKMDKIYFETSVPKNWEDRIDRKHLSDLIYIAWLGLTSQGTRESYYGILQGFSVMANYIMAISFIVFVEYNKYEKDYPLSLSACRRTLILELSLGLIVNLMECCSCCFCWNRITYNQLLIFSYARIFLSMICIMILLSTMAIVHVNTNIELIFEIPGLVVPFETSDMAIFAYLCGSTLTSGKISHYRIYEVLTKININN